MASQLSVIGETESSPSSESEEFSAAENGRFNGTFSSETASSVSVRWCSLMLGVRRTASLALSLGFVLGLPTGFAEVNSARSCQAFESLLKYWLHALSLGHLENSLEEGAAYCLQSG